MAQLGPITPVLRIFDETKAREFYLDFLGFEIVFEHRFEDGFPLYMGIVHSDCRLHLSEHHGDVCPGAHVRVQVDDVNAYSAALAAKAYKYAKPGAGERTPWGSVEVTLDDPFGNKLTFWEEVSP